MLKNYKNDKIKNEENRIVQYWCQYILLLFAGVGQIQVFLLFLVLREHLRVRFALYGRTSPTFPYYMNILLQKFAKYTRKY